MDLLIVFGKLLLAVVLGGLIGIEREKLHKAAGVRTCALITLGAALFALISYLGFSGASFDPSRIAGQVVVGIGFVCAGLVIFHHEKIRGLTTAAALWVCAAIGVAVGVGFYWIALFTTGLVIFILFILRLFNLEEKIEGPKKK